MGQKTKEKHTYQNKHRVMIIIAFIVTVVAMGIGSGNQSGGIIQVGDVAGERYIAPRDAVDQMATEKLKVAAANSIGPIYKNDIVVEEKTAGQINDVFQELNDVLFWLEDTEDFYTKVGGLSLNLPIVLNEKQLQSYEDLTHANRLLFAGDTVAILHQMYSKGVSADGLEASKVEVQVAIEASSWFKDLQSMAYVIVSAALEPNLVLDEVAMESAREEQRQGVADVLIRKNQKIVDQGEIIDQDIYDRLVSLKLIGNVEIHNNVFPVMGSLLMAILVFGGMSLLFQWENSGAIRLKENERKMLFWLYIIMIVILKVLSGVPYFTIIPIGLFAMLVSALIGRKMALILNSYFCVVGCVIFSGDVEFLIYSLISGSFGALLMQRTQKRSQTVPVALGMAAVNFLAMISVGLFFREGYGNEIIVASGFGAITGIISVVIAIGSLPFWEEVFEANTPLHLLELTNPNNELLRKLMVEAPGTYHHSLIVANLAETGVYAIGGNTALARAGAYYHDIGKLKDPLYFAENQSGYNAHDKLQPEESAKIIIRHTKDGYQMGKEYKLPKQVLNIMVEHHGNSLVKYFYYKGLKEYGAENTDENVYRYDGKIPQSRESAVVMLADTVEAAVRAMLGKGKTLDETEEFIKTLIKDKLDEDQLNESGLAIHELKLIRKAFMSVFQGMYHERVSYPKKEDIAAICDKEVKNDEVEHEHLD